MKLKHGVEAFDLTTLPRCGARCKCRRSGRKGLPCRNLGNLKNGRCRFHGGHSKGPRTVEGKQRSAIAHQAEALEFHRQIDQFEENLAIVWDEEDQQLLDEATYDMISEEL